MQRIASLSLRRRLNDSDMIECRNKDFLTVPYDNIMWFLSHSEDPHLRRELTDHPPPHIRPAERDRVFRIILEGSYGGKVVAINSSVAGFETIVSRISLQLALGSFPSH